MEVVEKDRGEDFGKETEKCPYCNAKFTDDWSMQEHIHRRHHLNDDTLDMWGNK